MLPLCRWPHYRIKARKQFRAVRDNFRSDLESQAARKVHRTSKELGLPTLNDIKDDFEKLAQDLGVGSK